MRTIAMLFLTFSFLLSPVSPALASESALSVSPAILELVVKPGEPNFTKAIIINTTRFPLPIKGQLSGFLFNNDVIGSISDTFNTISWISLDPADFILQPLEKKEVRITIMPPPNIEPGGHYATIYFQPLIPSEVVSPNSTISLARVGILTFLVVPGDIRESLTITDFQTHPWHTFGPIDFNISLVNDGNIHLLPVGQIEIKNILDQVVQTVPLNHSTILPSTTSSQTLVWNKQLLFGRYAATLSIRYGTNSNLLTTKPYVFWVIPWPIILTIIALLTLFYKLFIVHIDRVKLAIQVLKGKNVHPS